VKTVSTSMTEQPQQRALDLLSARITTMQSEVLKAEDKVLLWCCQLSVTPPPPPPRP